MSLTFSLQKKLNLYVNGGDADMITVESTLTSWVVRITPSDSNGQEVSVRTSDIDLSEDIPMTRQRSARQNIVFPSEEQLSARRSIVITSEDQASTHGTVSTTVSRGNFSVYVNEIEQNFEKANMECCVIAHGHSPRRVIRATTTGNVPSVRNDSFGQAVESLTRDRDMLDAPIANCALRRRYAAKYRRPVSRREMSPEQVSLRRQSSGDFAQKFETEVQRMKTPEPKPFKRSWWLRIPFKRTKKAKREKREIFRDVFIMHF